MDMRFVYLSHISKGSVIMKKTFIISFLFSVMIGGNMYSNERIPAKSSDLLRYHRGMITVKLKKKFADLHTFNEPQHNAIHYHLPCVHSYR